MLCAIVKVKNDIKQTDKLTLNKLINRLTLNKLILNKLTLNKLIN